jgi:hypothetical protein
MTVFVYPPLDEAVARLKAFAAHDRVYQGLARDVAALLKGPSVEEVARVICFWDRTGTCHEAYCGSACQAKEPADLGGPAGSKAREDTTGPGPQIKAN